MPESEAAAGMARPKDEVNDSWRELGLPNGDSAEGDHCFRREGGQYSGMIPVSRRRSDAGSLIVEEVIGFVKSKSGA